jgi:uncharacterized protein
VGDLNLIFAANFIGRARGLLFRPPLVADQALLLRPCRAVHTFFMRYAIDIVFLNRRAEVIKLVEALRPWRIVYEPRAYAVLELQKWQARRHGFRVGARFPAGLPQ